jgi:hypothetical protein
MVCYSSFPMRFAKPLGVLSVVLGLAACGGSLYPNGDAGGGSGGTTGAGGSSGVTTGSGGSKPDASVPCAELSGCECLAAFDRCTPRTEACWCPSECYPGAAVDCICGGGRFLACEDSMVAPTCATELAAVQAKCAGQAFVQDLGSLCALAPNPTCVAVCLANLNDTGSCSEIDCSFCQACDCSPPKPSPFVTCLQTCTAQP